MADNRYETPVAHQADGPAESYVVHGATLHCARTNQTSIIVLKNSHGVYLRGAAQLTINDYEAFVNIMPFGVCQQPNCMCNPLMTGPWIGGKADVLIGGVPALINTCTNICSVEQSTITIIDDGQMNES